MPPHLQKHFRADGTSVHEPEWEDVTPAGYSPDDEDDTDNDIIHTGTDASIEDTVLHAPDPETHKRLRQQIRNQGGYSGSGARKTRTPSK